MTDLTRTIAPKSDQLNSDDLIGGPRTIRITKVSLCTEPEQPIAINFEGDNGKPYKPCLSMRRVLVNVWGGDGNAYAGRSLTIYRDPAVQFGGMAVGGIRISHASDIAKPVTMALTATRANRKPFTVKPLAVESAEPPRKITMREFLDTLKADLDRAETADAVSAILAHPNVQKARDHATGHARDELSGMIAAAEDRTGDGSAADPEFAIENDPALVTT